MFLYELTTLAILFFVLVFNIKFRKVNDCEWISRLNHLRGIAAIVIILGHVARYETFTIINYTRQFAYIIVSYFFFVSGLGLAKSFLTKPNYIRGFLVRKPLYLFLIAFLLYVFNVLICYLFKINNAYNYTTDNFLLNFIFETNWYIWELIGFYFLFYIVFKYAKQYNLVLVTIILVIFVIISYKSGWPSVYYKSALAFPLGLLVGLNYKKINGILNRKCILLFILLCIGVGIMYGTVNNILVRTVFMSNLLCASVLIGLLYLSLFVEFNNKLLHWLESYSTEIYLAQFVWLLFVQQNVNNYCIKFPLVTLLTLLSAILLHLIIKPIKQYLNKTW